MPQNKRRLLNVAFELTLACNARCIHCGSRAEFGRDRELTTDEAVQMIEDVAVLGCERFTFSGGEPFLRKDWPRLAEVVIGKGMHLEAITNGLLVAEQAAAIRTAGFFTVGFSVDGPRRIHDTLRGVIGGFDRLMAGVRALRDSGIHLGAVTQINRINRPYLKNTLQVLTESGFDGWQLQLTMPHGRAGERADTLCLAPDELLALEDEVLALIDESPLHIVGADNFGYFGRGEIRLRRGASNKNILWGGCSAGTSTIGVTSDGTVRGCLSMPPTMDEGNIRHRALIDIWNDETLFAYSRRFNIDDLEGECRSCPLGPRCRAGCRSMALAVTGACTYNPYCLRYLTDHSSS